MSKQASSFTLDFAAGADISAAAAQFMDVIKTLMQHVLNNPSNEKAEGEHALLVALYKEFFAHAGAWAMMEKEKAQKGEDHPNALPFKNKAAEILSDTEKYMIAHAHCYMRLSRFMGFVKEEIARTEREKGAGKNIKWTQETGVLLGRYRKEREILRLSNEKLAKGVKAIAPHEKDLEALETETTKYFGSQGEEYLRACRSALRAGDFTKARKNLKALANSKKKFGAKGGGNIEKTGSAFIDAMEKNSELLAGTDGKMFMRTEELTTVIKAQEKEIETKSLYLAKYHQPYMEYKLGVMQHLKEKLLVVGSLDSLVTLYIRLIRGMAYPLTDMKAVREYEEEVLGHVLYLLGGQFKEIENIESRGEKELSEFYKNLGEFEVSA